MVRLKAKRISTNLLSAGVNQGKVRFKVFEGSMNTGISLWLRQVDLVDVRMSGEFFRVS